MSFVCVKLYMHITFFSLFFLCICICHFKNKTITQKTQTANIPLTTTSHVKSLITKRTRYMPMEMHPQLRHGKKCGGLKPVNCISHIYLYELTVNRLQGARKCYLYNRLF